MSKDTEKIRFELFYFYSIDPTPFRFYKSNTKSYTGNKSFKPVNRFDLINWNIYCYHTKELLAYAEPQQYDYLFAELLANLPINQILYCLEYHLEAYLNRGGNEKRFLSNTKRAVLHQLKNTIFTKGTHNKRTNYKTAKDWIKEKEVEIKTNKVKEDHTFLDLFYGKENRMNGFITILKNHNYLNENGKWNKSANKQGGAKIRPIILYLQLDQIKIIKSKVPSEEIGRCFNKQFCRIVDPRNYKSENDKDLSEKEIEKRIESNLLSQLKQLKKL